MPPFKLRKIDHIVLRVADLKASLRFYLEVIGCAMEKEQASIGLYQVRAGDSLIDLVPVDQPLGRRGGPAPGEQGRNLDHFAVQVTPFDEQAIRAHLRAHGVEIGEYGRRYGAEGDGPSLYISDPDGNVIELKGPADA
ncbi:MAG TPA: VOC family protein [Caulobacteraceae bacterium]|jgi:catechol 2,3-dioxygenase-like lactoylglutathione lyase family enzyme|nr:VOC family protein [Caulobacteraceae bacterium]